MKPAAFDYERPARIADAIALLQRSDIVAKLLAGGQSLGPMLNLRLVRPDLLVDITGIPELTRADADADGLELGACITHADIEDGRVPDVTGGMMPAVARGIAYRAVRNRGTIGGSLSHADPSADWVSALVALDAAVILRGPHGSRRLSVDSYIAGAFEVALEPGEMLEGVHIPRLGARARWGYCKFCRKTGEFAHAIGAVLHDAERSVCRAVVGATQSAPIVLADATPLFGGRPQRGLAVSYDAAYAERLLDERGMQDPYERRVHLAVLRRAVDQASQG